MTSLISLWSFALLFLACTAQLDARNHRRQPKPKDGYLNSSTAASHTTTASRISSPLEILPSIIPHRSTSSTSTILSVSSLPTAISSSGHHNATSLSTLTDIPPSTLSASVVSVACSPITATYTGVIASTVYETVTEGYDVTLTAADESVTAPPLLITPASACFATILPYQPSALPSAPACQNCPAQNTAGGAANSPTLSAAAALTSTVFVTKKTPVPVVQQTSSAPPVFQLPTTTRRSSPSSSGPRSSLPLLQSTSVDALPGPIISASSTTRKGAVAPTSQKPQNTNSETTPAPSPASKPVGDGAVPVKATSVVIGGQTISIPAAAGTTFNINGQTYTVKSSEIIGPSTTIPIGPSVEDQLATTAAPEFFPETVGSVTFSVGASQAVISGKTYAIGPGAKSTTVVVDGKTISIGQEGVGFATTTVAPTPLGASGSGPFSVITADGLTISVDASEAVISGTTYKLGPGASTKTAVVHGHTISIGPSGLGLGTTTVTPAAGQATSSAKSSSTGLATPSTGTGSSSAGSRAFLLPVMLGALASILPQVLMDIALLAG